MSIIRQPAIMLLSNPVAIQQNKDGSATVFYENGLKQRLPKEEAKKLLIAKPVNKELVNG